MEEPPGRQLYDKIDLIHIKAEKIQTTTSEDPVPEFKYRESSTLNLSRQRKRREEKERATMILKNAATQEMLDPSQDPNFLEQKAFDSLLQPLNLSIFHVSASTSLAIHSHMGVLFELIFYF